MGDYGILGLGTKPLQNAHPRCGISDLNGPSLASIRARCVTPGNRTNRKWYDGLNEAGAADTPAGTNLLSFTNSRHNTTNYPNSYYQDKDMEYVASQAFVYLMDNTKTTHLARAREVALYLMAQPKDFAEHDQRQWIIGAALVYDWCYSGLNSTDRATIRNALGNAASGWIKGFKDRVKDDEFMWGESHGDLSAAFIALLAILSDGNSTENLTWDGWMSELVDLFTNGTNSECYFPIFRHFGDVAGGTHKGSGAFGYDVRNEEFYIKGMPFTRTALGLDWELQEQWWQKLGHWKLWHWRGDRTFARQHEGPQFAKYHQMTQIHMLQLAARNANAYGEHCQWLADDIEALQNQGVWGPYQIWNILSRDTSRASVRPTLARVGNNQMYYFDGIGSVVARESWDNAGVSVHTFADPGLTGDHQQRCAGHFELNVFGVPLFCHHGDYALSQKKTYKDLNDATGAESGHRKTYYSRIGSHNCLRIKSNAEVTSNTRDSFQTDVSDGSRFGVRPVGGGTTLTGSAISNIGDQLWMKDASPTPTKSLPADLADFLGNPRWLTTPVPQDPIEESDNCYWVYDLTKWYWSQKFTPGGYYRRHFLWVKIGAITGWNYPIIIVLDDLTPVANATSPEKTCIFQLQSRFTPDWDDENKSFTFTDGPGRAFVDILKPISVQQNSISGFVLDGVSYPAAVTGNSPDAFGDSYIGGVERVVRQEINPAGHSTQLKFLAVICPCPSTVTVKPTISLFEDATHEGAIINGIDCKIKKGGAPFSAAVGVDEPPPPAPSNITKAHTLLYNSAALASGGADVTSAWQNNADSYETQVNIKLTNGSGITVAPIVYLEVVSDTGSSIVCTYGRPCRGTKTSGVSRTFTIDLPQSIRYFRIRATPPVGGSASLDVEFSKVVTV